MQNNAKPCKWSPFQFWDIFHDAVSLNTAQPCSCSEENEWQHISHSIPRQGSISKEEMIRSGFSSSASLLLFLPHVFHPCAAACWSVLVGVTSSAPAHTQRVVRASDATVIHLHTYTFTHTHRYVYTHTHICPHIQIYTHIHTLVLHSYIHTFLHPHTKLSKSVWSLWLLE